VNLAAIGVELHCHQVERSEPVHADGAGLGLGEPGADRAPLEQSALRGIPDPVERDRGAVGGDATDERSKRSGGGVEGDVVGVLVRRVRVGDDQLVAAHPIGDHRVGRRAGGGAQQHELRLVGDGHREPERPELDGGLHLVHRVPRRLVGLAALPPHVLLHGGGPSQAASIIHPQIGRVRPDHERLVVVVAATQRATARRLLLEEEPHGRQ